MKQHKKRLAILGSTGSIGTQTLDIVSQFPEMLEVSVLTANHNCDLLVQQALKYKPECVVIADNSLYDKVKLSLADTQIEVLAGSRSIEEVVKKDSVDMVVTAMVGYSGLLPTINAIKAKKTIALANKETLVVAGEIITQLARENKVEILPVDSEHSAIFQCLVGEDHKTMHRIILTASGGPFRKLSAKELENVTVKDALRHPNWDMGHKVTIDSASMMNKGFEMIEAKWLFDCQPENIKILIHPQSIVHSMVEYCDGSIKAQLGVPDMHLPIQYALTYPHRLPSSQHQLDWSKVSQLTFEEPDFKKFPLLKYAFDAIDEGGNMPCILNAANEVAVKAFLTNRIKFTDMPHIAAHTMQNCIFIPHPSLPELIETNTKAVEIAQKYIKAHCVN